MTEGQKRRWDFRLDVIKTVALTVGGLWVIATFTIERAHEMAVSRRELEKPYNEKKMALYLEASKVASHLLTNGADPDKWRDRFLELYWGELGFVESTPADTNGARTSVEELMVAVCRIRGIPECHDAKAGAALELARQAKNEIKQDMKPNVWDELLIWRWLNPHQAP